LNIDVLTREEIYEIERAALEVLEKIGIEIRQNEALRILGEAGATIDPKKMVAKIPSHLIKEALKSVPNSFRLAGRDRKQSLRVEKGNAYFATGDAKNVIGLDGTFRVSMMNDAQTYSRLADALDHVHFVYVIGVEDVPSILSDRYRYYIGFTNTSKPVTAYIRSAEGARDIVKMAKIIAGGEEELRKAPPFYYGYSAVSPLCWDTTQLDVFEVLVKNGIPVSVESSAMLGATGPGTLAGCLVVSHAEILAGILVNQLYKRGAPCIYCLGFACTFDMRTCETVNGSPEVGLLAAAGAQLARHYDLPSTSWIRTDSKMHDIQDGYEKALSAMLQIASGNNLIWGIGTIGSNTASYTQAVIDNEIFPMALRAADGIMVNDETLARDVIEKVGIKEHFLAEKHTSLNYRKENFIPELTDRWSRARWQQDGGKGMEDKARQKATRILQTHKPDPLPREVDQELWQIVKMAEEKHRSST
jgi:trimethylamine--corrinoid protein Co-methyltransferase